MQIPKKRRLLTRNCKSQYSRRGEEEEEEEEEPSSPQIEIIEDFSKVEHLFTNAKQQKNCIEMEIVEEEEEEVNETKEEYFVEKITKHKPKNSKIPKWIIEKWLCNEEVNQRSATKFKFFVKWKDFDEYVSINQSINQSMTILCDFFRSTWEPIANVFGCEKFHDYLKSVMEKNVSKKSMRKRGQKIQ